MRRTIYFILASLLVLSPLRAMADDEPRKENPFWRAVAAAPESPIGIVETLGSFKINDENRSGQGMIWRNDVVHAPLKMGARISLGALGQAALDPGTIARFTTVDRNGQHRDLVVKVVSGGISLTLEAESKAYLETGGSSFIAAAGSQLRFGLRENRAFVDLIKGVCVELGDWQVPAPPPLILAAKIAASVAAKNTSQTYRMKPIGGVNNSAVFDVRARSSRQVQVQVTDENDRPVPDLPIIFALGSNVGSFGSSTVTTNAQGIASVNLTGGPQPATSSFTATIQGTNISLTGTIQVMKAVTGFWSFQNAAPVVATAAAAAAVAAAVTLTKEEQLPIRAVGGPVIRP